MFSRGFKDVQQIMKKRSTFVISCFNCHYYYQKEGEPKELCQNLNVLKYDMVITDNNIYCNRWAPVNKKLGGEDEKGF
jgi:hypothetical protein